MTLRPEAKLLIVGLEEDPHTSRVKEWLEKLGAQVILFDPQKEGHTLEIWVTAAGQGGAVTTPHRRWNFDEIDAVWYRWKATPVYEWKTNQEKLVEDFVFEEWWHTLRALEAYVGSEKFLNVPSQSAAAQSKPRQLQAAARLGMVIPDTLFTNDSDAVLARFRLHEAIVYKPHRTLFIPGFVPPPLCVLVGWGSTNSFRAGSGIVFCNKLALAQVPHEKCSIHRAPGIFQELVTRECDFRVTVVGERIFCVKISSQASPETSLDWRREILGDMYELIETPPRLASAIRSFQDEFGINFGAYDFLVRRRTDGEEEYVFLECNPEGQWMWLETATGAPVSQAVAEMLLQIAAGGSK